MNKTRDKENLYFIALIPPEDIAAEVTAVKTYFAENYGSRAALRSPPHITLHMPFRWPDKKMDMLRNVLESFSMAQPNFTLDLCNYQAFPPRVIYIHVVQSEPLIRLQTTLKDVFKKELNIFNADHKDKPFRPHMTVAFRDLRPTRFREAWQLFEDKEFKGTFTADRIVLLKHTGKYWDKFSSFPLGKTPGAA